jgi:hypothetical protein
VNVLRTAGGWLLLVSVLQLCAAAAVGFAIFLLRGRAAAKVHPTTAAP